MSKRKVGTVEFSPQEKVEILREIEVMGNVSKVAQKYGVSRQSIYNWKSERDELDKEIALQQQARQVVKSSNLNVDALKQLQSYKDTLGDIGTLEERKEKLSAKSRVYADKDYHYVREPS